MELQQDENMRGVKLRMRPLIAAVFLRFYPHRDLGPIRVVFTDLEMNRDLGIAHLKEAFDLLEATDFRRFHQILKYVRTIAVWAGHYSAATPPNNIQLCSAHLVNSTRLELASVLVHEAVHLRIAGCGIPYDEESRGRIERRCITEQASFLRRLGPEGEAMAEIFEDALNTPWWTHAAHREDIERLVTDAGLPRFVISLMGGSPSDS